MTVKTDVMAAKFSFVSTVINKILNCDNISQYFVFLLSPGFHRQGLSETKMQVWAVSIERNVHGLILKYINAFVLFWHIYENYLNVLIELWPNPGLV